MRREGAQAHDHYDGVTGVAADSTAWRFSASQLVTLGSCPFSWFAAKLLELAEPEEADDELRPTLRGALYHDTLERTLRRAKDTPDLRAAALSALERLQTTRGRDLRPHEQPSSRPRQARRVALRSELPRAKRP